MLAAFKTRSQVGKKRVTHFIAAAQNQLFHFTQGLVLGQFVKGLRADASVSKIDVSNIGYLSQKKLNMKIGQGFAARQDDGGNTPANSR